MRNTAVATLTRGDPADALSAVADSVGDVRERQKIFVEYSHGSQAD
jgi:hypothetical protein